MGAFDRKDWVILVDFEVGRKETELPDAWLPDVKAVLLGVALRVYDSRTEEVLRHKKSSRGRVPLESYLQCSMAPNL